MSLGKDKISILLVDDDRPFLTALGATLQLEGFQVTTTDSGKEGIELAHKQLPDLIICDVMMPPPNGFEVLETLTQDPKTASIPFIFLTAHVTDKDKVRALISGADDHITKPFRKEELLARIKAILRRKEKTTLALMEDTDSKINSLRSEISKLMEQSESGQEEFVQGLIRMLALRDNESEQHTWRVTNLTEQMATALGFKGKSLLHIRWGAILHDIGKVGIPDRILQKPGPLTEEEREVMYLHPEVAYEILVPLRLPPAALEIPLRHHERWDGLGYPGRLSGEKIPLSARIFAVVDVWDALTSDRPYRKAWPAAKAREYILENSGKHFDPKVVDVFLNDVLPGIDLVNGKEIG